MKNLEEITNYYKNNYSELCQPSFLRNDSLEFSVKYSLVVENTIQDLLQHYKVSNICIATIGSLSRRELSTKSEIEILIIPDGTLSEMQKLEEVMVALDELRINCRYFVFDNKSKYIKDDIHIFCKFLEARFIFGNESNFNTWKRNLFSLINDEDIREIFSLLIDDSEKRQQTYGHSSKMVEPNLKYSSGGLRDLHEVQWLYSIIQKEDITTQNEISQSESFINRLVEKEFISQKFANHIISSFKFILTTRNLLHYINNRKVDRLEFNDQKKIAEIYSPNEDSSLTFMNRYFEAAGYLSRFYISIRKRYSRLIYDQLPDALAIDLDDDFVLKGNEISMKRPKVLSMSDMIRAFYYRALHSAFFDDKLKSYIIDTVDKFKQEYRYEPESSTFFRELLRLPKNVGQNLELMNDLCLLGVLLPEFNDIVGYFQPTIYHCYTFDEHSLKAILNLEDHYGNMDRIGVIYNTLTIHEKSQIYLALLFHDIAKPIQNEGNELLASEISATVMRRLGYSDSDISRVSFIIKNKRLMDKTAFNRNLLESSTINVFSDTVQNINILKQLYLFTYANLTALNPAVWTSWKMQMLDRLYTRSYEVIEKNVHYEEEITPDILALTENIKLIIPHMSEEKIVDYIKSISDIRYFNFFADEAIAAHIKQISEGDDLSVIFEKDKDFTKLTLIVKNSVGILAKACGIITLNHLSILDGRIYTNKAGITIANFTVVSQKEHFDPLNPYFTDKFKSELKAALVGILDIDAEITKSNAKFFKIDTAFFKRKPKISIEFEEHEKFTIIDIASPDKVGIVYKIAKTINELNLTIYFSKTAQQNNGVVSTLYVLNQENKKVSTISYDLIRDELEKAILEIM